MVKDYGCKVSVECSSCVLKSTCMGASYNTVGGCLWGAKKTFGDNYELLNKAMENLCGYILEHPNQPYGFVAIPMDIVESFESEGISLYHTLTDSQGNVVYSSRLV